MCTQCGPCGRLIGPRKQDRYGKKVYKVL